MLHYLNTQAQREPEMVSLLTQADGLPQRASDIAHAANSLRP